MTQYIKILKWFFLAIVMFIYLPVLHADTVAMKTVDLVQDWGLEPVLLRISANGYMIEFRYKVLDPEKAEILSHKKFFPSMLSMKSKAKLSVPYGSTVGYLKSNRKFLKKGKNYIIMFSNENRHMLPGDKVRIQAGDEVSPPLTIEY